MILAQCVGRIALAHGKIHTDIYMCTHDKNNCCSDLMIVVILVLVKMMALTMITIASDHKDIDTVSSHC